MMGSFFLISLFSFSLIFCALNSYLYNLSSWSSHFILEGMLSAEALCLLAGGGVWYLLSEWGGAWVSEAGRTVYTCV